MPNHTSPGLYCCSLKQYIKRRICKPLKADIFLALERVDEINSINLVPSHVYHQIYTAVFNDTYNMYSQVIDRADNGQYLGVHSPSYISFSNHVNSTNAKASEYVQEIPILQDSRFKIKHFLAHLT